MRRCILPNAYAGNGYLITARPRSANSTKELHLVPCTRDSSSCFMSLTSPRSFSGDLMVKTGAQATTSQVQTGGEGLDEKDMGRTLNATLLPLQNDPEVVVHSASTFPEGGWPAWKTVAGS